MRLLPFCFLLYLFGVIQAVPTTNTTSSNVSEAEVPLFTNTRTMWNIVSSSLLTMFACVYSAIHPNIPSPKDSLVVILWRRLGIMMMALIAPELIVIWAVRQWISARHANYTWTHTHSFFMLMGGFMLYVDGKPYLTLRPDRMLELIHDKSIDIPTLTVNRIHDKSKGNAISKGLIILQVTWFVIQLITRAIYHLETTQLEVGTLAFAVLNFLSYVAWWNKPLNVQCPYPVYLKSTESRPEHHINVNEAEDHNWILTIWDSYFEILGASDFQKLRVPTFDGSIALELLDQLVLALAGLLMATIFGGVHCMAWFFAFPTYQEQVLWRMSAIAISCTPSCVFACFPVILCTLVVLPYATMISWLFMFIVCPILYIIGRAILLVLMFTTLRDLPPDAYKAVSWTALMPHL
ncbi:uncharacterized protein EDB93DRAFT_1234459 [Suillus bovinus]|uniref:uncharacterized protein n=1 Tax=Suillus bovinus TaxID=48563 RepID=UPI001B880B5F|nr:uncharacterized protein EDB93DRAFT_1095578 [Suillus bovinus]XP_041301811.1 uncharacterized protein EDB93DRAFT_1234459 [Suillus bovinus]KAG2129166.1 hypothetical protein EDB93DRAFT_1095578 [Suillus bovinus]KAG2129670.1 hypothetical protein EDB93DRAFT_1234459 [Suillus bovinus]